MVAEDFGLMTTLGSHEGELTADRADVYITVRGSALFSGEVGLDTVREVAELVEDLRTLGIDEDDIQLYNIDMDVNARMVGRSSSATCKLRITCHLLALLPKVSLSIRARKHASVDYVRWSYTFPTALQADWLALAIEQATEKAKTSAKRVGVEILGVDRVREGWEFNRTAGRADGYRGDLMMSIASYGSSGDVADTPDIRLSESRCISVRAEVTFRISSGMNDSPQ